MEIYSFINTLKKYGFSCCRYDHAINNRTSSVSAHIHINGTPSHSRKKERKSTAPQEIIFSVYKLFKYNNIVDFFYCHFFSLLCFKWIVAHNEGNEMCGTKYENHQPFNGQRYTRISFHYGFFFRPVLVCCCSCRRFVLISFGFFKQFVRSCCKRRTFKDTDMTIIL